MGVSFSNSNSSERNSSTSCSSCSSIDNKMNDMIFYPENPGMDGWVDAIMEAAATVASNISLTETDDTMITPYIKEFNFE